MKLFKMKKILILFALLSTTLCFTGCGKKHVAAIILPNMEELEAQRNQILKKYREQAEIDKKSHEGQKWYTWTFAETFIAHESYWINMNDIQSAFTTIEEIFSERKDIQLVDRRRIEQILEQHQFEQSLWSNSEKVAEIGQALNVDTLIFIESEDFFPVQHDIYTPYFDIRVEFLNISTFAKTVITARYETSKWNWEKRITKKSKKKLRKVKLQ